MARHAPAKKRRRNSKVVRKAAKHKAVRVVNSITDDTIRSSYDKDLSPTENLIRLGLDPNPNDTSTIKKSAKAQRDEAFLGFANLAAGDIEIASIDRNPKRKKISEVDAKYATDCVAAHGDNYKAMSLDIALNYKQLTEAKLKKLCLTHLAHVKR